MIVAVDGPAGVGKSTVAQKTADKTGFEYLNSGNIYRAFTLAALRSGAALDDEESILGVAQRSRMVFHDESILLDGEVVDDDLHCDAVDNWVAQHSAIVPLRRIANQTIRSVTEGRDAIIEGRDIGTVVYPDAGLKIYLDASVQTRAERRFAQGVSRKTLAEIRNSIEARDRIDRSKKEGSLKQAADAHYIDTTHLTIDEVCDTVVKLILNAKCKKSPGS